MPPTLTNTKSSAPEKIPDPIAISTEEHSQPNDDKKNSFVENYKGFLVAVLYGGCSILCVFFNKAILSQYNFGFTGLMMLGQVLVSLIIIAFLHLFGIISCPSLKFSTAMKTLPLTVLFVANVLIGLAALRLVNIPMFTGLRRLTSLFIIFGEWWLLNKKSSTNVHLAVCIMIFGALIGSIGDLTFDVTGYILVFLNNATTSASLVMLKLIGQDPELDSMGLMLYNNILSLPFVLIMIVIFGELEEILEFPLLSDSIFWSAFIISCALVFMVNYTTFLCTSINSALTTSITGQMKNLLTSAFGMIFCVNTIVTPELVLGAVLGATGSGWYAFEKYNENRSKK